MGDLQISVVIPARNAAHLIGDCLGALFGAAAGGLVNGVDYEVIVVDNNSTDDTAAVARAAGARVVTQTKVGAAAARNAGIAVAKGDIIAVTDADCRPTPGWLVTVTEPLRSDPSVSACKGTYLSEQRQLVARFVQLEYQDKYDLLHGHETIDFIDTYSAAYRREVLDASGGFDESVFYVEDQELSFRLAAMGCRMVFQPGAVVYHRHADSLRSYSRKKFHIGFWKAEMVRRFPNVAVRDSHTPQVMKVQMALVVLAGASVPAALVVPAVGVPALAVTTGTFAATTVPFVRKAWRSDRAVALASPALLAVRAAALTAGYVKGTLRGISLRRPTPRAVRG